MHCRLKHILLLASAASILSSCSLAKEKSRISVDRSEVELYPGDTAHISARGGDGGPMYVSANEFIAVVDQEGIITAQKVGTTTVRAVAVGSTAPVKVTVNPRSIFYAEPFTDWTLKEKQVRDTMENYTLVFDDQDNHVLYYAGKAPVNEIIYWFTADKLSASAVIFSNSVAGDISGFLGERYLKTDIEADGYQAIYVNGYTNKTVTLLVGVTLPDENGLIAVTYQPKSEDIEFEPVE